MLLLLEEIQWRGLVPDVIAYDAKIGACGKAERQVWALELLEEMREQGLEPDVISCNAEISACENGARPEHA
jgi:pentatricopeptide repeat protein